MVGRLGRRAVVRMQRWMMRMRRVDDILHEGPPITAMPIPVFGKSIASLEGAGKIMAIHTREAMTQRMHALEQQPSAGRFLSIPVAHIVEASGVVCQRRAEFLIEVRLDHAVVTPGLE